MDIDAGLPELIGGGKNRNTKDRPRKTHNTRSHTRSRPTPTPSSTLESIALEENNLKSEMNRLSLKLRDVEGDGNCLFRALADQLWGEQKRHAEVRYRVCDFLEENQGVMRDFVVPFMQDGEDYSSYVNRMRQLSESGDMATYPSPSGRRQCDCPLLQLAYVVVIDQLDRPLTQQPTSAVT